MIQARAKLYDAGCVVAGVDGCPAGWVAVFWDTASGALDWAVFAAFADVLRDPRRPAVIAVDMPVGLLDAAAPGGRACDRAARALLGRPRAASVFSPPVRAALRHRHDYHAALAANRESSPDAIGISKQAFNILPKIAEVDGAVSPALQRRVKEAHPELAFRAMNGGAATIHPKRRAAGREERLALLSRHGFGVVARANGAWPRTSVAWDDLLDAAACCWTAARILRGEAKRVPDHDDRDGTGLLMEIWA